MQEVKTADLQEERMKLIHKPRERERKAERKRKKSFFGFYHFPVAGCTPI